MACILPWSSKILEIDGQELELRLSQQLKLAAANDSHKERDLLDKVSQLEREKAALEEKVKEPVVLDELAIRFADVGVCDVFLEISDLTLSNGLVELTSRSLAILL